VELTLVWASSRDWVAIVYMASTPFGPVRQAVGVQDERVYVLRHGGAPTYSPELTTELGRHQQLHADDPTATFMAPMIVGQVSPICLRWTAACLALVVVRHRGQAARDAGAEHAVHDGVFGLCERLRELWQCAGHRDADDATDQHTDADQHAVADQFA
jgi:hypothetical protein